MDVVGVFAVACAVSFGGGTLRDLFLDRSPLFWISNPHYPVVVLAIALLAGVILRFVKRIRPLLPIPDAVGMALFTLTGTGFAIEAGTDPFIAALLGTITGTFGGVLGDLLCNEVPALFRPSPLNATCAFAGAWVYWGALQIGLANEWALLAGGGLIVAFRLAAIRWNWSFPGIRETR